MTLREEALAHVDALLREARSGEPGVAEVELADERERLGQEQGRRRGQRVEHLLRKIRNLELIRRAVEQGTLPGQQLLCAPPPTADAAVPFLSCTHRRLSDMAELLASDPVQELGLRISLLHGKETHPR